MNTTCPDSHRPCDHTSRRAARCFVIFAACAFALLHGAAPAAGQTIVPADVPTTSPAPTPIPKTVSSVREIDATALAKLLPRLDAKAARPVLVNFWATWCEPCRVEFPDLVKIDNEFRPRGLDFFTVSLDDPAEIATSVPAFLSEMKATRIPAYLLNTPEPADAINLVDKTWSGALPATFLFNRRGELVYKHFGLINPAELRAEIEKALTLPEPSVKPSVTIEKQQGEPVSLRHVKTKALPDKPGMVRLVFVAEDNWSQQIRELEIYYREEIRYNTHTPKGSLVGNHIYTNTLPYEVSFISRENSVVNLWVAHVKYGDGAVWRAQRQALVVPPNQTPSTQH